MIKGPIYKLPSLVTVNKKSDGLINGTAVNYR